jgi:short-subunit dehydrogenase|tara:strand:+ start:1618 stop:1980 length:363 start_codon:yes stop_codon:yes gene_type:complete
VNINKTILISGASRNPGNYLAKHHIKKKFNVISISRKSRLSSIQNFYLCDLSDINKTKNLFLKLKKKFKKIDLIISCAGASKKKYKISENINDWKFAFNNNFYCFTNLLESYLNIYAKKN